MNKKFLLFFLIALLTFGTILFSSCNLLQEFKELAEDLFYTAVKEIAPDYTVSASGSIASRAVSAWNYGDPIYELYGILLDGEWGGYFNLYDVMQAADAGFEQLELTGSPITPQAVDATVNVGFNGNSEKTTYDTFAESTDDLYQTKTFGRVDENNIVYMLYTGANQTGGKEKRVVQGWYDQTTGDVAIGLFFANYLDPAALEPGETAGWEIIKAFLSGNTETAAFSLKVIRDGTGYDHNVTGYGISEGEGNYFLLKLANNSLDFADALYYEFAADATVEDLQAMDAAGAATVPANTVSYEANLPANYTATDLLTQEQVEALDVTAVSYTE